MKNKTKIEWFEETGVALCTITDSYNRTYHADAFCHPNDQDMMSEKTGCEIANRRAEIMVLKGYVKNELKPRLRALKQLYYSMNRSKYFNEKSYENKMLQSQIRVIKNELDTTNEIIAELEYDLSRYLNEKDEFYKKVRKHRKIASLLKKDAND